MILTSIKSFRPFLYLDSLIKNLSRLNAATSIVWFFAGLAMCIPGVIMTMGSVEVARLDQEAWLSFSVPDWLALRGMLDLTLSRLTVVLSTLPLSMTLEGCLPVVGVNMDSLV